MLLKCESVRFEEKYSISPRATNISVKISMLESLLYPPTFEFDYVESKIPADPLDAWLNRLDSNTSPSLRGGTDAL